jgi:cell division protein FtsI (penicillin-binding protein 3)
MAEHVAPGSTFKLASIVAGIEDGKFDVTDSVDLYKGKFQYYDRVMIDSPHNYSKVTVEKAFVISSNVGISQLIHKNYKDNPSAFTDRIYKMGLSTKLDLELPYPSAIKMPVPNQSGWSGVTLPWMSNGYEMAITPLHLLTFYNAIANNGKMMKPIFTTKIINDGQIISEQHPQVINPAICSRTTITKIIPLLTGVVERGTAKNIKSNKYQIAGKTGTTVLNYAGRKKDEKKKYQASFIGFFPAYNPKYSCIVVVNNPRKENVYGGKVAAPIFKELADKVYSLNIDIHEPLTAENVIQSTPNVKTGDFDSQEFILNHLEVKNLKIASEKESLIEDRIHYDLERLIMPSLIGMNLKDALYLFEKHGLEVVISGSGGVVSQSIKKGDPITKQTVIKLEFS